MSHRYLFLCFLALTACGEVEDTRPGQPVKQRQAAFKDLLRTFEPMGKMLREGKYDATSFLPMAERLHAAGEQPWQHFGPDTQYPPSHAKPEVWSRPADFDQAKQVFHRATSDLLTASRQDDKAAIKTAYQKVQEACQACHRTFREK